MRPEIAYNDFERAAQISAEESLFVHRLKANEDAAYDELVRVYHTQIFHVAFRMLGDSGDAADVVQEIFLKVFRNINGFKGESSLKTWIFRIAFSEILNRLRWWKRRHRQSTFSLDDDHDGNGNGYHISDTRPTPEEAFEHRSIVILRDIEGFSYGEIADVLGVSIGTVKSRLARARADLKKALIRYLSVQKV